jgi:hypothetical protein
MLLYAVGLVEYGVVLYTVYMVLYATVD